MSLFRGRNHQKKTIQITLGAWNVHTLLNRATAPRSERRTALVACELARYRIQIAALSETWLAGEGNLTEVTTGYTFYWSGRSEEEAREAEVGFAIDSKTQKKLTLPPKAINDQLMTLRLPLSKKRQATVVSVYAPTMTNTPEAKDKF